MDFVRPDHSILTCGVCLNTALADDVMAPRRVSVQPKPKKPKKQKKPKKPKKTNEFWFFEMGWPGPPEKIKPKFVWFFCFFWFFWCFLVFLRFGKVWMSRFDLKFGAGLRSWNLKKMEYVKSVNCQF